MIFRTSNMRTYMHTYLRVLCKIQSLHSFILMMYDFRQYAVMYLIRVNMINLTYWKMLRDSKKISKSYITICERYHVINFLGVLDFSFYCVIYYQCFPPLLKSIYDLCVCNLTYVKALLDCDETWGGILHGFVQHIPH